MERTVGIEPNPVALGRRTTRPACLPARWLRPGNGLHRSKVVIRNESRLCAAGSFATSATVACVALFLSACHTVHTADFLATPADRLVCEAAGARPKIPAEYQIDWSKVATVAQAKAEHDKYVAVIHTREGIVAAYVLSLEGKLFVCSSNAQWRRDYEAELAKSHAQVQP